MEIKDILIKKCFAIDDIDEDKIKKNIINDGQNHKNMDIIMGK